MWMMPLHLHVNQKSDYDMMICDAFCDFGACGGTTSSAENATLDDVNKILMVTHVI